MEIDIKFTQNDKNYNARTSRVENSNKFNLFVTREDKNFRTQLVKNDGMWAEISERLFFDDKSREEVGAEISRIWNLD